MEVGGWRLEVEVEGLKVEGLKVEGLEVEGLEVEEFSCIEVEVNFTCSAGLDQCTEICRG